MQKIGIIGGGFSGTLTAFHIIEKTSKPVELIIFNSKTHLHKGTAYHTYSKKHLLNVSTAKMSALPDYPNHFLDWVLNTDEYKNQDRTLLANAFLPRTLYGEYIFSIGTEMMEKAALKNCSVEFLEAKVVDMNVTQTSIELILNDKPLTKVDYCVLATGNQLPGNPAIKNKDFFSDKNYFQNPWQKESVSNLRNDKPVLILGNGLTMVDTVLGLLENGFTNTMYTLSPNGFNILPHRYGGIPYFENLQELTNKKSLLEIVKIVNKHIKAVRKLGISAEAVIDAIRPHTQQIWKNLSVEEKKIFMSRLRHLWGVARHRIPLQIHDKIQKLRIDGKLIIIAGKIINIQGNSAVVTVEYYNKKKRELEKINVSRIINCTGPQTNIIQMDENILKKCLLKEIITQDELKLGIKANIETFETINAKGENSKNIFTLGSNLKGELWETTAVPEIRVQAQKLAQIIVNKL